MANLASAQIPAQWAQYTVEDTVALSAAEFWERFFQINLEDVGSVGDYKNLPRIIKTTPVRGDFSAEGHARRVHFDTDETLLESIIESQPATLFAYELTEIELGLRRFAHRARGQWQYFPLADGRTRIVWTYGFDQKNALTKLLLRQYIRSTHRHWMQDTLSEMIRIA
ncbi:MAG TPA: hypothetical protein DCP28_00695, partial [Cytophagales bacterium]|nr:hypothetical protein [Cytophagales bacterium]